MSHNRVRSALVLLIIGLCPALTFGQHYTQTNLVSDLPGGAPVVDPNLRNPWGLVHGPATPWWISDNFNGLSTVYNTSTTPTTIVSSIVVTVPNAAGDPGHPTGIVFNGSATDFLLAPGKPAVFIWVTEDGTIDGWHPSLGLVTKALVVFPPPNQTNDAVYKGATIAEIGGQKYLLVANFKSGQIDVFDSSFHPVDASKHAFRDQKIRKGFAPFNVQGIGPNVVVTYAKQDDVAMDDVPGLVRPIGRRPARRQLRRRNDRRVQSRVGRLHRQHADAVWIESRHPRTLGAVVRQRQHQHRNTARPVAVRPRERPVLYRRSE